MFILNYFVALYYNVILGWVFYFLINSMTMELPWKSCDHFWNTEHCNQPLKKCLEQVSNVFEWFIKLTP